MYTFESKNCMDVFNGDLTEFLLGYGISIEHIDKMKNKILENSRSIYYNYPPLDSPKTYYIKLVPLDKVIGTSRGTVGLSVYENVRTIHNGERDSSRFTRCLNFLNESSLENLRKSYENLSYPVIMDHYVDDDTYFTTSDGNHRTLTAMLVGAEYIKAKVTDAGCDYTKKEKVLQSKNFEEKYRIVNVFGKREFDIWFKDDKGIYEIRGYPGPLVDDDLTSFLERLSITIDNDMKKANKIMKFSPKLQKYILRFVKNSRIKQYVNISYLTEPEIEFPLLKNRCPIKLYNLKFKP